MNLKQLSTRLGLSQTTVSRALNGYPEVSEATRQKVRAAAEAHGYRPNARARSLATGRSQTIGHIIPVSSRHEIMNPIFADFIAGAGEAYRRAGYDMTLSIVNDDHQDSAYRALARRQSVDGIVVHGPRAGDKRVALLREIGLPFVVHGRATDEPEQGYSWVDVDNRRAFARATNLLCDLGHRRIALINGREGMDFVRRRHEGFTTALAERGFQADPALITSDEMTEQYGYEAARRMLALPNPPSAFLVASMISAIGVRRAVDAAGLRLGRDISIITHDDALSYLSNGGPEPIFTATRSSVREAGRITGEMLLGLIRDPGATPKQHLLEAELVIGASTGPAPR